MRAIIYTRVSTDEQADKGFSLRHQKMLLETYCTAKKLEIVKYYQEDYSAKNFNRPEFKKLMDFVKENKKNIDAIVFTKWDRFSRNLEESLSMIRIFRNYGIEIIAVEQPLDMSNPDNKLMLSMYLTMPEVENDKISQRTRDGMRRAMKEGCYMSTKPFGYDRLRTELGKATLIPNKDADTVLRAFELYSKGTFSIEEVRRQLKPEGLKLNKQNFNIMLRNVVYIGKIYIKPYGKEEEQVVEGLHNAIVPDKLFYRVQSILNGRRNQPIIKKRVETLPLRGYLVCPECGRNLTGSASRSRSGARYEYYHCQDGCKVRFRADFCNEELYKYLKSFDFTPEIVELYQEILRDVFNKNEGDKDQQIKILENDKKNIEESIVKAEDKVVEGDIDHTTFKNVVERYRKRIDEISLRISELSSYKAFINDYIKEGLPLLKNLEKKYITAPIEIKQKIIGSIFPGKLTFNGKNYRTNRLNEVISLMTSKDRKFRADIKKQTAKNGSLSRMAPPSGLEPETL